MSQHTIGQAADIRVEGMAPAGLYRLAKSLDLFGGFGLAANFLHVDVRISSARWMYGPDGKQCPWNEALMTTNNGGNDDRH